MDEPCWRWISSFPKDYGFKFKSARPMQIGLVYDALKTKIRCCCWLLHRWPYCGI